MKWIFFFTLFLNLVVVLWFNIQPETVSVYAQATDPGVEPITLLSELAQSQKKVQSASVDDDTTKVVKDTAKPKPPPKKTESALPKVAQSSPKPVSKPDSPPVDQNNIGSECFLIDLVRKKDNAKDIETRLLNLGFNVARTRAPGVEQRYWVYMPPLKSLKQAYQMQRKLKADGVRDLQVLPSGKKKYAISLGLYTVKAIAEKRLVDIRLLGYEVALEVSERESSHYQIRYRTKQEAKLSDSEWRVISSQNPNATLKQVPCN